MAILSRTHATAIGLLATALAVPAPGAWAQSPHLRSESSGAQAREGDVKAVFLYNFAKYVDWPAAPAGGSYTIRMCVPANPAFLATLQVAVRDEVVNGRPLRAIDLEGLDAARDCDVLYVGEAGTPDATAWLGAVRGRQVLTVGDGKLVEGLVIAFVRDQDRVRFDISRLAATKQNLSISSRLLGLARRVTEP